MAKRPEDEDDDDLSDFDLSEEDNDTEEEFEEFDTEEDLFEDTEEDLYEDAKPLNGETVAEEAPQSGKTEKKPESKKAPQPPPEEELLVSIDQIPVSVVVEVGRIKMSMDQLLKIEPGNFLELDIHPENGIDLTINGKLVGKGELVRIGESLGVRVIQLGRPKF